MRGAKPKPIEQKILEGDTGHRPLPEVMLVSGRPDELEMAEPPEWLPNYAKQFWRETIVELARVGILDRVDQAGLEMLATTYARWRQAAGVIAVDGHFAIAPNGSLRVHPAVAIERNSAQAFFKMAEHYALTPIGRTRLGIAEMHARTLRDEINTSLGSKHEDDALEVIDMEPL